MDVVVELMYGQQSIENVYRYNISACFFCYIFKKIKYIERDDPANQVFSVLIRRKKHAEENNLSHIFPSDMHCRIYRYTIILPGKTF